MTQITISKQRKQQSAFQKLWDKAERLKKQNLRFRDDLEALVQRVQITIQPAERDAASADKVLLHKLLNLGQRKSLAQWQRGELGIWIHELIDEMYSYGLVDAALLDDMARYDAFNMGITLEDEEQGAPADQLRDIIQREQDAHDARMEELERESEAQEKEVNKNDEFDFFFDEQSAFEEEFYAHSEAGGHESLTSHAPAITKDVLQRLFRSAAAKLHPDREPDPKQRKIKQGLMGDLLKARKSGDVMTILALHQEHVGGESFSKTDEQYLLSALEMQIVELNSERDRIAFQSPIHEMVYAQFYHPTKKKVEQAIADHLKQVSQDKIDIEKMVQEIRSLKALKPWLEKRYDARELLPNISDISDMDIDELMDILHSR